MDIQDIARLHTSYAQPPLTIEMASPGGPALMLEGAASTAPSSETRPVWSRFSDAQRQAIAVLIVAAVAFPIGMWTASGGKHDIAPPVTKALAPTTLNAAPGSSDAKSHEWPTKDTIETSVPSSMSAASLPMAPTAAPPVLASTQARSEAAPATAEPSAIAEATSAKPSNKPPAKAPILTATKPTPAPAAPVPAQAGHADPRRSNEIKLF